MSRLDIPQSQPFRRKLMSAIPVHSQSRQVVRPLPQKLPSEKLDLKRVPRHVAIIMDGNGRWAKQRHLPRFMGHRQGVETLKQVVRYCQDLGIQALTVYAFSTENWKRPAEEVEFLMQLFEHVIWQELNHLHEQGVRLNFIGDLTPLPLALRSTLDYAICKTETNQSIHLNVALNYGGRNDIVRACQKLSTAVQHGLLDPSQISEALFADHLDAAGDADPDLLIRTSGEMRLSNFLLWQLAYTEIYCTATHWPDFSRDEFDQALWTYQQRDRRFGQLSTAKNIERLQPTMSLTE
jgi:undecaprenyl diphosphate synthase